MPWPIQSLADKIRQSLPVCEVSVEKNDNILIQNQAGTLGFAITRKYMDDHGFDASFEHAIMMAKHLEDAHHG